MSTTTADLSERPTRARFGVLALISACVTINYLDRALLDIVALSMQRAFSWIFLIGDLKPMGVGPAQLSSVSSR